MGRLAVERLATALDEPEHAAAPETIRLPMTQCVRESTGPAPARSPERATDRCAHEVQGAP
jgi:hypothetical protein